MKNKLIHCQSCGRIMRNGDQYFMVNGRIVCANRSCLAKASRGKNG